MKLSAGSCIYRPVASHTLRLRNVLRGLESTQSCSSFTGRELLHTRWDRSLNESSFHPPHLFPQLTVPRVRLSPFNPSLRMNSDGEELSFLSLSISLLPRPWPPLHVLHHSKLPFPPQGLLACSIPHCNKEEGRDIAHQTMSTR